MDKIMDLMNKSEQLNDEEFAILIDDIERNLKNQPDITSKPVV